MMSALPVLPGLKSVIQACLPHVTPVALLLVTACQSDCRWLSLSSAWERCKSSYTRAKGATFQ